MPERLTVSSHLNKYNGRCRRITAKKINFKKYSQNNMTMGYQHIINVLTDSIQLSYNIEYKWALGDTTNVF